MYSWMPPHRFFTTLNSLPATVRRWAPPHRKANLRTRLPVPLPVARTVTTWVVRLDAAALSNAAQTAKPSSPGKSNVRRSLGDGLRTQLAAGMAPLIEVRGRAIGRQIPRANIRAVTPPKRRQSSLI